MRQKIDSGYKPGDLPPQGYLQWHSWAEVQRKAGIPQMRCGVCGLFATPQEFAAGWHSHGSKTPNV